MIRPLLALIADRFDRTAVALGIRSRCCHAPLERPIGWGDRAHCAACHRRVR